MDQFPRRDRIFRVALVYVLVTSALFAPVAHTQLAYLQQNSAVNPLQGQATPPDGFNETDVQTYVVLNRLLSVNDATYSFKANFWWGMVWEDDRTADLIQSNGLNDPTYICQAWCSTEQGLDIILEDLGIESNGTGQAACCDGVYVPGSLAENVIGYDVQSLPVQYQLSLLPNGLVSYRVQVQGEFYSDYNFKSYPFDRHQLAINIETQFTPRTLDFGNGHGADFLILYAQNYGNSLDMEGNTPPSSVDVYNSAKLSQGQAWQIDSLKLEVMNYTTAGTGDKDDVPTFQQAQLYNLNSKGVRFTISISRTSKGFYALMIIVPISLIILFSFVIFILPVTQIKGRMNIVATLFLTLIVLQFVLEGIMPQSYTLIPPYYLLLVSYVYIFGLVGLAICTNSLATQWQRRSQRILRKGARKRFWDWVEELPPPQSGPERSHHADQLPVHHNPMTDSRQTMARILNGQANNATPEGKQANGESAVEGTHNIEDIPPTIMDTKVFKEDDDFYPVQVGRIDPRKTMDRLNSKPWSMKERGRIMTFLLRSERVRWWSMWWHFIGLPESKEYCEFCAVKVEHWVLPILFLSYAVVVAVIFGVAQATSHSNIDSSVG